MGSLWQVVEVDAALVKPFPIRLSRGQSSLNLKIVNNPMLCQVDQEHPPWLKSSFLDDMGVRQVKHPRLGGKDNKAVVGHPVARRAQTVAVQHRTDLVTVSKNDTSRTIPWLHEERVELVEVAQFLRHLGVLLPCLRDHHKNGMGQGASTQVK